MRNRLRRGLPLRFCVCTRSTFTLNNSSTARRMSSLVAERVHLERVGVVPRRAVHALFGHQRPHNDLVRRQQGVDAAVRGSLVLRCSYCRLVRYFALLCDVAVCLRLLLESDRARPW